MKYPNAATLALICLTSLPASQLHAQDAFWASAETELQAASDDFAKGGILTIGGHVENFERILTEGAKNYPPAQLEDGNVTVLVDGRLEALAVAVRSSAPDGKVKFAFNPYPSVVLYLALYYNEVHKPEDALRAIDAGMKLSTPEGLEAGAHMPNITTERAAALNMLKRFQEGYDVCDKGLRLASASKFDKARMYRCRGFSLIELGRLEDAQLSYDESLKLDPDSATAKIELACIAKLRAGTKCEPPTMTLVPIPQVPGDKPATQAKPI